jgi:hypothetical protein
MHEYVHTYMVGMQVCGQAACGCACLQHVHSVAEPVLRYQCRQHRVHVALPTPVDPGASGSGGGYRYRFLSVGREGVTIAVSEVPARRASYIMIYN